MPFLPQPELHPLFEALGYAGGYYVYKHQRANRGDQLHEERLWLIIAAAAVGALFGSRILGVLEELPRPGFDWHLRASTAPLVDTLSTDAFERI